MARLRNRRLIGWVGALAVIVAVWMAVGACHPQEPPSKRDASGGDPNVPKKEPY
jgi:hypothetical protein